MAEKKKQSTEKPIIEEKNINMRRRFVRMQQGAKLYNMGLCSFRNLARDAKATYRVKKIVLVDLDQLDDYLEEFREVYD